jgi:hypothetical protein
MIVEAFLNRGKGQLHGDALPIVGACPTIAGAWIT